MITSKDYVVLFDFLEFCLKEFGQVAPFTNSIARALVKSRAAYRVVEDYIIPISSEQQAQAITHDLAVVNNSNVPGASLHLKSAAACLSSGDWSGAVRESIHAVEAAAKSIDEGADTLGPALSQLEKDGRISAEMKKAFGALYGYASQEGVRHALVFGKRGNIREEDAMFMFGACAAFTSYLLSPTL